MKNTISSKTLRFSNVRIFEQKFSNIVIKPFCRRILAAHLSLILSKCPSSFTTFLYIAALSGTLKNWKISYQLQVAGQFHSFLTINYCIPMAPVPQLFLILLLQHFETFVVHIHIRYLAILQFIIISKTN